MYILCAYIVIFYLGNFNIKIFYLKYLEEYLDNDILKYIFKSYILI